METPKVLTPLQAQLYLAKVKFRPYQLAAVDALENAGFRRLYLLWHRRAGKDYVSFYILLRQALNTVGNYVYCLPTYRLARRVVFDSILSDGTRFLSMIPEQLVHKINSVEMKITLINGSIISIAGSNTIEKNMVGINPIGIIYSEWSRSLHTSWSYLSPAILMNKGFAIFITTPKGKTFAYEMWDRALNSPEWFTSKKTVDDTNIVPRQLIENERKEFGDDFVNQEYYCNFTAAEGSFYGRIMDKLYLNDHITDVPYDPSLLVHTFWDLGYADLTVIIYAQISPMGVIRVIDCDYGNEKGLADWIRIVFDKPYHYGTHWGPHDLAVHEFSSGESRIDLAEKLGLRFEVEIDQYGKAKSRVPNVRIADGVEKVKLTLPNCYFDEIRCERLIKGLDNYRREWDEKRSDFKDTPVHNADSHFCFVGETLILTPNGQVPISDIKEGDYVLTPLGKRKVLATHSRLTEETYQILTRSSAFECTKEHEIFTSRGLVMSDQLRYTDALEYYGKVRSKVWKLLFGVLGTIGFKKAISFLRIKNKSCLIAYLIDGMGIGSVLMHVRRGIAYTARLIMLIALAVYAKIYSIAINTLLRRHVVKSVLIKQYPSTIRVYDLTIETDSCYYANGYLVSNSDSFRYLALSISSLSNSVTKEDLMESYITSKRRAKSIPELWSREGFNGWKR